MNAIGYGVYTDGIDNFAQNMNNKNYGYFGWKEFQNNRNEILNEYDRARAKNTNRPIQTSHGNAGEAAIRNWLSKYLPKKYGVTSGFIIPDIITNSYKLYHYDIIIFDSLNSPILWIDEDYDTSEQGKKRAVPAKYVYSVIEVKSTFTNKSTREAVQKLVELNTIASHFPSNFSCSTIFFELKNGMIKKTRILDNFMPNILPFKYWGGMIMRTEVNPDMVGAIKLFNHEEGEERDTTVNKKQSLVKNVDDLKIYKSSDNNINIEGGAGLAVIGGNDGNYHFSKQYYSSSSVLRNNTSACLCWSYNEFARFAITLLSFLEGINYKDINTVFGQVFDKIE